MGRFIYSRLDALWWVYTYPSKRNNVTNRVISHDEVHSALLIINAELYMCTANFSYLPLLTSAHFYSLWLPFTPIEKICLVPPLLIMSKNMNFFFLQS